MCDTIGLFILLYLDFALLPDFMAWKAAEFVIMHSYWCLGENGFGEFICKDGSTRVVAKFIMDALSDITKTLSKEYTIFLIYSDI